jgi:hypothetical protein
VAANRARGRADAAEGEGRKHAECKGGARSDETLAVVDSPHREPVEVPARLLRRPTKQPLDAEAQSAKNEGEERDGPPSWNLCVEEIDGSRELVGQIGERGDKGGDVLSGLADTGVEVARYRARIGVRRRFAVRLRPCSERPRATVLVHVEFREDEDAEHSSGILGLIQTREAAAYAGAPRP